MLPKPAFQHSHPRTDNLEIGAVSLQTAQQRVERAVQLTRDRTAPVWPLRDFVAVNPYLGFAGQNLLDARMHLRTLSDVEFFMPVDYYRQQYQQGGIQRTDIANAIDELVADGVLGAERIDVNQVVALLNEDPSADVDPFQPSNPKRTLCTIAESIDHETGSDWSRVIAAEISQFCASHYDQGQALWASRSREFDLFTAWREELRHDRTFEILGVKGFRSFVQALPAQPEAALASLLQELEIPEALWEDHLLCTAMALPGWSAWAKYQHRQAESVSLGNSDFAGLLAMRLAYEVALSRQLEFRLDWPMIEAMHAIHREAPTSNRDLMRYALMRASEIAFRSRLITDLRPGLGTPGATDAKTQRRKLAQIVFCIDVRSERIRRHLEGASSEVETFGFAGFFGMPIEFIELGAKVGQPNVPALITPQFKVRERINSCPRATRTAEKKRSLVRSLRKAWKGFQSSAVSMFAFVETMGLWHGVMLLARSAGFAVRSLPKFDGVERSDRDRLAPSLTGLIAQGLTEAKQVDLAESMLRGVGVSDGFARLVVLCGHGSRVENNPLKAGLDCGACGGHTGEPNARFAAKLLNEPSVRDGLRERGIAVPEDTVFVAALHNTTTDEIEFFDRADIPRSHWGDLADVQEIGSIASHRNRKERLPTLPGPNVADLDRRSADWSEVRPEWGLAGNAAFIVAPRSLSKDIALHGRSFLHSYDYREDPEFNVLEQIMTAPLVVANWINLQYLASTVDPDHFGSGNKTIHNVVGQFGVLSGNGGDLKTGLPWQSVHDGNTYQHHPLRLLAVIAAPREAIESILGKHPAVADLITNGWLQLLAIDDAAVFRLTEQQAWEPLSDEALSASLAEY